MPITKSQKRDEFQAAVRGSLAKAEAYCARYRPWDTRLLVICIACGTIATLLAGGTVLGGQDAAKTLFGGWMRLCTIVAAFTGTSTIAGAVHKSLQITTRVASAEKCIARLRSLDATIAATGIAADEAVEAYRRISEEHSVVLA